MKLDEHWIGTLYRGKFDRVAAKHKGKMMRFEVCYDRREATGGLNLYYFADATPAESDALRDRVVNRVARATGLALRRGSLNLDSAVLFMEFIIAPAPEPDVDSDMRIASLLRTVFAALGEQEKCAINVLRSYEVEVLRNGEQIWIPEGQWFSTLIAE